MTVHRPNTRAFIFRRNAVAQKNQPHYYPRPYKLYTYGRECRWCRRRYYFTEFDKYPKFCYGCGLYLIKLEKAGDIDRWIDEPDVPF